MADKELLEMAAKAAGIDARRLPEAWPNRFDDDQWNPLIDYCDLYQLAKKLKIDIHLGAQYVTYFAVGICGVVRWPQDAKDDAYAIVQAAAEIGKAMP